MRPPPMQTTKVLVGLQEVVMCIILTTLLRTYIGTCVTPPCSRGRDDCSRFSRTLEHD
jgi:hypothetical protein